MEVSLVECPACGTALMGGETVCPGCSKPLPTAANPVSPATSASFATSSASAESPCPRCGMMVPKQALRCRDCGS
jgi:hypothetical protein